MSEELKRKLQKARATTGDTQKAFAARLGVPLPTYIKWENSQSTPSLLTQMALEAKINEIPKK